MAVRDWRPVASDAWVAGETSRNLSLSTALVVNATLVALVVIGLAVRVQAALRQPLFVDEAFSLLAIDAVGTRGVPILPTGVLYLHGATLSYLLSPWLPLGWVQPDDLTPFRIVSAIAGAAAIFLTFRLARSVGASSAAALLAAALVAIDPASVQWGGYVRMYALAQALAVAVALLFVMLMRDSLVASESPKRGAKLNVALVMLFWLAVYTHLATAMLLPAMAIVAVAAFGRGLYRERKDVTATLAACAGAPMTLIALTGFVGAGAGTKIAERSEGIPGISFLGDDKIDIQQVLNPDPSAWASLFGPGPLEHLLPLLMTVASTILLVRCLLRTPTGARLSGSCQSVFAVLTLYWLPVLMLAFLAGMTSTRYGLFLVPLGCVILSLAIDAVYVDAKERFSSTTTLVNKGALLVLPLVALLMIHDGVGVAQVYQMASSGKHDLAASLRYVKERRQPNEWILSVIPPPMSAYVLKSAANLAFLPGGEASSRTLRYTRRTPQGWTRDYWIGVPTVSTFNGLCAFLAKQSNSWLVVDKDQWDRWGYSGGGFKNRMERRAAEMQAIVLGTGVQEFEDRQAMVLRVTPTDQWSAEATELCGLNGTRQGRKSQSAD